MTRNKLIKFTTVLLSVLLGISIISLAGTLIYNYFFNDTPTSVVVPDNYINDKTTSQAPDESESENDTTEQKADGVKEELSAPNDETKNEDNNVGVTNSLPVTTVAATNETEEDVMATAIYLHSKNVGDNEPFNLQNMFPGDSETKYFCVKVYHNREVSVKYRVDIRKGYESSPKCLI